MRLFLVYPYKDPIHTFPDYANGRAMELGTPVDAISANAEQTKIVVAGTKGNYFNESFSLENLRYFEICQLHVFCYLLSRTIGASMFYFGFHFHNYSFSSSNLRRVAGSHLASVRSEGKQTKKRSAVRAFECGVEQVEGGPDCHLLPNGWGRHLEC